MAQRRCFNQRITESDAFLEMPLSTQCLYFHLNMNADDDGFVNCPKRIIKQINASEDDMKLLIAKSFVICFENGLIVIKHWLIHNTLQKDRYKKTEYQDEFNQLITKDNKLYELNNQKAIANESEQKHKYGSYKNVLLSDKELETLKNEFTDYEERIERVSEYCASSGKSYKNYLATIRNWARKEKGDSKEIDSLPQYKEEWL